MFIARQPIFNTSKQVYGYELLFRESETASAYNPNISADSSTAVVLGGLFELGIDKIAENKKAFVNFDYNFIVSDNIELVDSDSLVIEVLEDTQVDKRLLDRLNRLRNKGYKVALDDFTEGLNSPLVRVADIIKYDVTLTPLDTIRTEVNKALKMKKILLAEKVETEEDFRKAKEMGFLLFQGYFFSKPVVVGGIKARPEMGIYRRILSELQEEEPSFKKIAAIIETDVNMAYRILKIKKPEDGKKRDREKESEAIKAAVVRMGLAELQRWGNVLMLQQMSNKKSKELVRISLIRSKFGELIAERSVAFRMRKSEVALMCLFSLLDTILNSTMEEALKDIDISESAKEALINKNGELSYVLLLMEYYEQGSWDEVMAISNKININADILGKEYLYSIKWTKKVMES